MLTSLFLLDATEPILFKTAQNVYLRPYIQAQEVILKVLQITCFPNTCFICCFFKARLRTNIWGHSFKIGVECVRYLINMNIMTSSFIRKLFQGLSLCIVCYQGNNNKRNKDRHFQFHSLQTPPILTNCVPIITN